MPPEIDELELIKIEIDEQLMWQLRDAQRAFDEVKEHLENIKDEIKKQYRDHGHVIGICNGEKVFTCAWRETNRIDSVRLKSDYPEIWHHYSVTKRSQYLSPARPKAES